MMNYILLVSRQGVYIRKSAISRLLTWTTGKVRLAKWFTTLPPKAKAKIVKDVTQLVLARRTRMCNFLEYKGAYPVRYGDYRRSPSRRHESGIQAICQSLLRLRHLFGG